MKDAFLEDAELVKELLVELRGDITRLVEYGFKRVSAGPGSIKNFYVHEQFSMVVKRPYLVASTVRQWKEEPDKFFPPHSVKTVVVDIDNENSRQGYEMELIFIQPVVDTKNHFQAWKELCELGAESNDFFDRNCGWLNGQPVMFDW